MTFSPHLHNKFTSQEIFMTSFYIFTTNSHHKGTNRQGQTDSIGTHRQIFTTNLHHRFSPQISLLQKHDLGDKQTKISVETMASSNILIHSPGNLIKKGCTDNLQTNFHHMWCKFVCGKILSCKSISQFSPRGVNFIMLISQFSSHVVSILSS